MFIKKQLRIYIVLVCLFCLFIHTEWFNVAVMAQDFLKPDVSEVSKAVFLVNTDTNEVIYEKNADTQYYPAALVNIMTAIVAIENVKNPQKTTVTVPSYIYDDFVGRNVSHVDIRRGEKVTMEDLLYASVMRSACEASSAIADYVGKGSIAEFVDMMNEKAAQLGATDTFFTNANGLYNSEQLTTARDMYIITKYALSLPLFDKIAKTKSYTLKATNIHKKARNITHSNPMLSPISAGDIYYPNARGIKTGISDEGGYNLISTATRSGYNYLLVTLNASFTDSNGNSYGKNMSAVDHKKLYEWVFDSFEYKVFAEPKNAIGEVPVLLGESQDYVTVVTKSSLSVLLPKEIKEEDIKQEIRVPDQLFTPIEKGDVVGRLYLKLKGKEIASVPLLSAHTVKRSSFQYFIYLLKQFYSNGFVVLLTVLLVLLIILFIMFFSAAVKRAKKIRRIKRDKNMEKIKIKKVRR